MKYLRKWDLPTLDEPIIEHLERPEFYGESYFWYCTQCRQIYASAILNPEDCTSRPWRGMGGLCLTCPPHRFQIRGDLTCNPQFRREVPSEVALYLLDREIDFIGHPAHPHNEVAENG